MFCFFLPSCPIISSFCTTIHPHLTLIFYTRTLLGVPVEYLTIPSQRRYVQYFTNMLGGLKPSSTPLLLRRVIMKTIPNYSKNPSIKGCCPYIQVFQCGKLIATAAPRSSEKDPPKSIGKSLQLKWLDCSEGSISFTLDCPVQVQLTLCCCFKSSMIHYCGR
jgi:hypothetical protein